MGINSFNQIILVTGPARSGKSGWAEFLAVQSGQPVTYIATAQTDATDLEWQARIDQHRGRRPKHWTTLEIPDGISDVICSTPVGECLLVDSLGSWVSNQLEQDEDDWEQVQTHFLRRLKVAQNQIILVAEETGWGVVPAYSSGRQFRDRLGKLVQAVGAVAHRVYLVTGGHVLDLTQLGTSLKSPEN